MSRSRSPRSRLSPKGSTTDSTEPITYSLASLVVRSLLVFFLFLTSLSLALLAWFSFKSYLKVDPYIGRERVWLQYGEFRTPYAIVELPQGKYGAPGQSYDFTLELTVPSSEQNLAIGNFMVSISLNDVDSDPIVNASRPAILTHPTYPRFAHVVPTLRPIPPPTQHLEIPLLESVPLNRNSWSGRKVEKVFLEVGRKDAHSLGPNPTTSLGLTTMGTDSMTGGNMQGLMKIGGELQVYESWLKIQVRLYGLRALIRSHPYLSFLFFFPSFLLTELLAALAVYAYFVLRPSSDDEGSTLLIKVKREGRMGRFEEEREREVEEGQIEEIKREEEEEEEEKVIKEEDDDVETTTSEPPSGTSTLDEEEEQELDSEERLRLQRRREIMAREAGPGGKGMSEFAGDTETEEEESGEGEGEGTEGEEGSEEWEGVQPPVEEKDFDETATIGGSETTRASRSTFGPSVAGTSSTRTTTTATSIRPTETLRERQGRNVEDGE